MGLTQRQKLSLPLLTGVLPAIIVTLRREACCPRNVTTPLGAIAPARGGIMNPRMCYWWKYVRHHNAERWAGWGAFTAAHGCSRMSASGGHAGDSGRAPFGVRRPLRLLAYKLGLEDEQVRELARILDHL